MDPSKIPIFLVIKGGYPENFSNRTKSCFKIEFFKKLQKNETALSVPIVGACFRKMVKKSNINFKIWPKRGVFLTWALCSGTLLSMYLFSYICLEVRRLSFHTFQNLFKRRTTDLGLARDGALLITINIPHNIAFKLLFDCLFLDVYV